MEDSTVIERPCEPLPSAGEGWVAPAVAEIRMDAEVGSYQDDFGDDPWL